MIAIMLLLAAPMSTGMVSARTFLDGAQQGQEDVLLHFDQPDHPLEARRLALVTVSGDHYYLVDAEHGIGPNPPGYIVPTSEVSWAELPPP